jgi:hypothetical protein
MVFPNTVKLEGIRQIQTDHHQHEDRDAPWHPTVTLTGASRHFTPFSKGSITSMAPVGAIVSYQHNTIFMGTFDNPLFQDKLSLHPGYQ